MRVHTFQRYIYKFLNMLLITNSITERLNLPEVTWLFYIQYIYFSVYLLITTSRMAKFNLPEKDKKKKSNMKLTKLEHWLMNGTENMYNYIIRTLNDLKFALFVLTWFTYEFFWRDCNFKTVKTLVSDILLWR